MSTTSWEIVEDRPGLLGPRPQRRLFIHDPTVMHDPGYEDLCLAAQYCLAERALWLADRSDLVVLAGPLEEAYLEYMRSLGAGPAGVLCAPDVDGGGLIEAMLATPQWAANLADWAESEASPIGIDTFCTTRETHALTELIGQSIPNAMPPSGNAAATLLANHKSCVHEVLDSLDIPKIPGCIVETTGIDHRATVDRVRRSIRELSKTHPRVIVRTDYSSGGRGNLIVGSGDTRGLEGWLKQHSHARKLLVESFLPWKSSPNVQYWLAPDGTAELYQITDQRMSGATRHIGNEFPSTSEADPELHRQSAIVASWLARIGVRGIVGMDFIDTFEAGMRFVEVNARVNGSTYASAIALRMNRMRAYHARPPLTAWRMHRQVPSAIATFAELLARAADLLYDHDKRCGVVPYWTGAMQYGCCGCVTLAEEGGQLEALETAFLERIAVP